MKNNNNPPLEFIHTDFTSLMQKRIYRILIICSNYDSFILEEDGRIDDRVFKEYTSLNFSFPPSFLKAHSHSQAMEIISSEKIDLVITMLHGENNNAFTSAEKIKTHYPNIPIVVLTPYFRNTLALLKSKEFSIVDYVFSWLGNADLILAIIKLIEDKMNAANDMLIGSQAILLVDDSFRFLSQELPALYKILFKQTAEAALLEGLNEHQTTLRKRARPKILLARNYTEAISLYNQYKNNLIGVISDVNLSEDESGIEGIRLCQLIRKENFTLPLILQSGDVKYSQEAIKLDAGFINKNSKHLLADIENNITYSFGFDDFIFRNPHDSSFVARVSDLHDFQHHILQIPDESFVYHASRNDFSRWFNTRGLFSIARLFKHYSAKEFDNVAEMKTFVFNAISAYKKSISSTIVAQFNPAHIDKNVNFHRIGEGSIGGKARGLAFLNQLMNSYKLENKYSNFTIAIPKTLFIGTDYFDEFIESNNLFNFALNDVPDDEILKRFVDAHLPQNLIGNLRMYLTSITRPLAIRSSSKLEDSYYQPFAGIYATYMVSNTGHPEKFLCDIADAIKAVYASVFMKESKAYIDATSNVIDEEKMAIVLQEMCGNKYVNHFYPLLSGVIRSVNFYPISPEKTEDGIANIAVGLGKYVVDNMPSLRFSPSYPSKVMQHHSLDSILKESQKTFYALNLDSLSFKVDVDDKINLNLLKVQDAADEVLSITASIFEMDNQLITDNLFAKGRKVITFSKLFQNQELPFAQLLKDLLVIGKTEMNCNIEIEFAIEIDHENKNQYIFNLLQIRPIGSVHAETDMNINESEEFILLSQMALGNGIIENITDIVYVKIKDFDPSKSVFIAEEIDKINATFKKQNKNYILIGPNRWGTSDPWLGIPVKWSQISEAMVIVEIGLSDQYIEPSQGTHFFQNITTFQVAYMVVNQNADQGFADMNYLDQITAISETEYLRHVRFDKPLKIIIDGRKNKGVICKP